MYQITRPKAKDLLETSHLSLNDRKDYAKVIEALSQVFVGKLNIIYECAKFHLRKQVVGESFDLFLADLIKLVEYCNYRDLKDKLVKDCIVVGIVDKELSGDLQVDIDLTLEKVIQRCYQRKSVVQQNNELLKLENNPVFTASSSVNQVRAFKKSFNWKFTSKVSSKLVRTTNYEKCWGCGRQYYLKDEYPAS